MSPSGRLPGRAARRVPVSRTANVTGVGQKDVTYEWFSPGSFRDRTQSQALTQSSYEELVSGIVLGFEQALPAGDTHTITFDELYKTDPSGRFDPQMGVFSVLIPSILDRAVEGRTAAPLVGDRSALVTVKREQWVTSSGATTNAATSETAAHAVARPAGGGQSALVAAPEIDIVSLGAI